MITHRIRLIITSALVLSFGPLLSAGCDMGLQESLNKKKAERFAQAAAALDEIAQSRLKSMVASFPKKLDADVVKRGKQIVQWRFDIVSAKHVDPKADPKASAAAVKVKELARKRFATSEEAKDEVDKLVTEYNIGDDFAKALRDTALGASGRDFENEVMRAIDTFSPVRTYHKAIVSLGEEYKGTPTEQAVIDAAAFAKTSHEFWSHAKEHNFGRMAGTAAKYIKFLQGYLKAVRAKISKADKEGDKDFVKRVFLAEAEFDITFLHAAAIWRASNPVPFWAVRFGVTPGSAKLLSQYVTKLCRESDQRERCLPVPHERRSAAMRKPYLSWVKDEAAKYVAANKGADAELFRKVFGLLDTDLTAALKAVPDLSEDPVMPEMFTARAGSVGFNLVMSAKQGVKLKGLKLDLVLAEKFTGTLPPGFKAKVAAKVAELVNPETKAMIDVSTVSILAEGSMAGTEFKKLTEAFPYETVNKLDLFGRRRADESMRTAGVLIKRPKADKGKNLTYQLDGMTEKKVCSYIGFGGDPTNRKRAAKFMIFSADGKFKAGDIVRHTAETAGENKELIDTVLSMKPTVTLEATATAEIQKHADTLSGGVRVFLPTKWTYGDLMKTLTGLTTKCTKVELKVGKMLDRKITIKCGETKERPFRFDLGLCN